ncbi:MAG: ribonuclease P subunit p25 family protein [Promethearchaeota archaeon]
MDNNVFYIKNRREKEKIIKDVIFAFSGGQKSLLIKGEGDEISTAVEIAEILKSRLYPGIEIGNVSLGSRPFFVRRKRGSNYNKYNNRNKKDLVSQIEITLKTKTLM